MDVQEAVEACSQDFGGKLLFVGTGQTAVTGTAILARLQGRFTIEPAHKLKNNSNNRKDMLLV
jgi:hypothetical protein